MWLPIRLRLSTGVKILIFIFAVSYIFLGYYMGDYVDRAIKPETSVRGDVYYKEYIVNITVMKNGSLLIREYWDVIFQAYYREYRFGYRIIPISGFDDIGNIRVYEVSDNGLEELKTTVVRGFGKVGFRFYFEPIRRGEKIFILSYMAINAVWEEGDYNTIKWVLFPEEHPPISIARALIVIPGRVNVEHVVYKHAGYVDVKKQYESDRTIIVFDCGYLHNRETVGIYVRFDRIAEAGFSMRKILSGTRLLLCVSGTYIIFSIFIAVAGVIVSKRTEYVSFEEVVGDMDPIEFSYIATSTWTHRALVAIFYLASLGLVEMVMRDNKIYVRKIGESREYNPWVTRALELLPRWETELGMELLRRIGQLISMYERDIFIGLRERGYIMVRRSERFEPELSTILLPIGIFAISALILHAYGVSLAYQTLCLIPIFFFMIAFGILSMKSNLTPRGNGAIKSVRSRVRAAFRDLKIMTSNIQSGAVSPRILENTFGRNIAYFIAFLSEYISILEYILEKEHTECIPYVVPQAHIESPTPSHIPNTLLSDFLRTLVETLKSLVSYPGAFGTGISGLGGGIVGGGGGGGGSAGFG